MASRWASTLARILSKDSGRQLKGWAISFHSTKVEQFPEENHLMVGAAHTADGVEYQVTARTRASYRGVEGDLPFAYWNKEQVLFVDFRTQDNRFATLDFSETPAILFLGQFVDFDELHLKNLRQFEGWF